MKQFTNLFSQSKTLRFELQHQGETLKYFLEHNHLEIDKNRKESYAHANKVIDTYHKYIISKVLSNNNITSDLLEYFYDLYIKTNKSEKDIKDLKLIHDKLRKEIAKFFSEDKEFKDLFKKE